MADRLDGRKAIADALSRLWHRTVTVHGIDRYALRARDPLPLEGETYERRSILAAALRAWASRNAWHGRSPTVTERSAHPRTRAPAT